jgi:hypothetical protein
MIRSLKMASSFVLGRPAPCDVAQGYVSVAGRLAASLEGHFEQSAVHGFTI